VENQKINGYIQRLIEKLRIEVCLHFELFVIFYHDFHISL
jgi:hypothetical protein